MMNETEKSTVCQHCGLDAGPIGIAAFFRLDAGLPTCDPCYRARQDTPHQAGAACELIFAAMGGNAHAEALLYDRGYLIAGTLAELNRLAVSLAKWAEEPQ